MLLHVTCKVEQGVCAELLFVARELHRLAVHNLEEALKGVLIGLSGGELEDLLSEVGEEGKRHLHREIQAADGVYVINIIFHLI